MFGLKTIVKNLLKRVEKLENTPQFWEPCTQCETYVKITQSDKRRQKYAVCVRYFCSKECSDAWKKQRELDAELYIKRVGIK